MTDSPSNPERTPERTNPEVALDLATLIRCAADDNLSMAQADALHAHLVAHPEDQARIDFERGLRDAVATAMDPGTAPARLRHSIETMFAERPQSDTVGPAATRDRSFWRRSFLPTAVAAMVLMAFGVTLIVSNQSRSKDWSDGLGARVVSWVEREHNKCCDSIEYRQRKLTVTNVADAQEQTRRDLGAAPRRIQLDDAGYTFAGYGPCRIPGGGASGQLIYTPNSGEGEPISLFVQRDDGRLDGVASLSDCLTNDQTFIWRADGLIYYLVVEPKDRAPDALQTLGAPANHLSL